MPSAPRPSVLPLAPRSSVRGPGLALARPPGLPSLLLIATILTWVSSIIASIGLPLCSNLVIERVERLCQGAVNIEPPVANEILLVHQSPIGAEEAELVKAAVAVAAADVEGLALSLWASAVSALHLAITGETGVRNLGEYRVILSGNSRNRLLQRSS